MPKEQKVNSKGYKIQTKKNSQFTLPTGSKGFLITCRRGRERNCKDELRQLFEEWAETHSSAAAEEDENEEFENVEEELESELAKLKNTKREKMFSFIDTGVDCIVFSKIKPSIDPVFFLHSLLSEMQSKGLKKTRYTSRILPVQDTCLGKLDDILEMSKRLIESFCASQNDSITYSIVSSVRNNQAVKKNDIISQVASLVPAHHKVNLTAPDHCIIIEVVNLVCCISIVSDYFKLKKYNVDMLIEEKADD